MWVDLSMMGTVFSCSVGIFDFWISGGPPGLGDLGGLVGMLEDMADDFRGGEGLVGGGGGGRGLEILGAEAFGQMAEHRDAKVFADADAEGWLEWGGVGKLIFGVEAGIVVEAAAGSAVLGCSGVARGAWRGELEAG